MHWRKNQGAKAGEGCGPKFEETILLGQIFGENIEQFSRSTQVFLEQIATRLKPLPPKYLILLMPSVIDISL